MNKIAKKITKIFMSIIIISLLIFVNNFIFFRNIVLAANEIEPSTVYAPGEIDSYLTDRDGKIAFWTNNEKTKADIVISYKQEINDGLYLATLCNAHGLSSNKLSKEISAVASLSDVNLYLDGKDIFGTVFYKDETSGEKVPVYQGEYRITNQKAHTKISKGNPFNLSETTFLNMADGPTKGQYVRVGAKTNVSKDSNTVFNITSSGEHANVRSFANDIIEALGSGEYDPDFIVISFDAWAWACQSSKIDEEDDSKVMLQAAKLLKKYYDEKRVIWLTSRRCNNR